MASRQKLQAPNYGNFPMGYHTDMIRDHARVGAFEKAIKKVVKKGTKVLELGCGTGILSIIAASCGASVIAVENDENVYKLAKKHFSMYDDLDIKLIKMDAISFINDNFNNKFDVIIAELMSIWCIEEPQVPVINIAQEKILAKNGVIIPGEITNFMAIGNFTFGNDIVECAYPIARFTGVPDAVLFSETKFINKLTFDKNISLEIKGEIIFEVYASGIINCVQISSLVQLIDNVVFYNSDTLMPVTIIPLKNSINVISGDKIKISYHYKHHSDLGDSVFEASKI